ncbi:MAG TPA: autotransporter-associated beta strand repeat-containing protein, partial [Tepidisphaeraceae bacterium]|nr:autotransporter-associated beta strand repeat-containing protein [Tepidisphaeraceae bacterium]
MRVSLERAMRLARRSTLSEAEMSLVNGRNLKRARRSMVCSAAVGAAWAGILCPGGATAQAASGTWITNATGLWSASTNWSGGVVADGSGNTADFSTLDISGTSLTVNLDSARTIGQLLFEDQTNLSTDWILANNATPANVLTLGTGAGTPTISVFDRTATITTILAGTQGLAKNGGGTLVLAAANTLTGGVSSSGGLLKLDFSQATSPTTNIIPASNAFTLNGGTLQISGKASTTNSQAFAGTTLSGGGGLITMSPATTNPLLLNLGAITRSPGAALNVTLSGTSSATNGVASSTANNSTGIIGGYATVGGATNAGDWAANNGANVVAYTAYNTAFPTTGGDSSINYSTTAGSTLTSDVIANSLKVISGANTYALGGNNLTFSGAAGGLLYADSSASSFTGTGVLGAGSGNEFIVQDWGAGALTIGTPIIGTSVGETGRLTKAGTGTIVLTAANTYTGGTMLVGGQITVSNNAALGTGSIEINPNGVVGTGNGCKLLLSSGVTIANNIIMDRATAGSGTNGTIDGSAGATGISGNITINGIANPGGTFIGPTTAGTFLTITGSITNNLAADNGGTDAIIVRNGNVLLSGGGSYYRFDERAGTLAIGVSNGVATNASVDLGGNGTATFDLAGLNQTL